MSTPTPPEVFVIRAIGDAPITPDHQQVDLLTSDGLVYRFLVPNQYSRNMWCGDMFIGHRRTDGLLFVAGFNSVAQSRVTLGIVDSEYARSQYIGWWHAHHTVIQQE